ncbi:alpha/beta fold hydrolase [Spirillospora sp. NPDC046719]
MTGIVLDAAGVPISALLAEPPGGAPPRAVIAALHGAGLRAGYFDGRADPGQSLLRLGARLGFSVLALDRPGYGASAEVLPDGQPLVEQAATVHAALADFAAHHPTGAGIFLLGHSYGGKLALVTAADETRGDTLLGIDVSGVGHRYAVDERHVARFKERETWAMHWGPLSLYPPGTFRSAGPITADVPAWETAEAWDWPDRYPDFAARVRVPIRVTFAEHERWWHHDEESLRELAAGLKTAPLVVVDRLANAGHNLSLGVAARTYHLRALAFLEECLATPRTGGLRWANQDTRQRC